MEKLLQQCTVKLSLRRGWGTGFFVAPGLILTCDHVVQESIDQPVKVRWQKRELEAVVEQSLPDYDLALLRVTLLPDDSHPCVYLDEVVESRDPLYLFGYPDQDFPNGCPVTFSCEGLTGDEPALIKFALGQVRPGMSGSPLLNQRTGKICGLVKFTRDRSFDLGGGAVSTAIVLTQFPALVEQQRLFHQHDQRWLRQMEALSEPIPADLPRSGVVKFVGRAQAMVQLHEMLQQADRVSAIAGMGGIGKTELALQYALAYKQNYSGGICWLQACSSDVGAQLVKFGRFNLKLNIPDGLDLADQVKYCWCNWKEGEVLLVFDNVTDYIAIKPYLPPVDFRFKVLLTTRSRFGKAINHMEVPVLDKTAALALLEALVGAARIQFQLENVKKLIHWLGHLPLGLELVGRYLEHRPDLSIAKVLQQLEQKRLRANALKEVDADMTAQLGVAAAFELSWDMLTESAQQLGCFLSLFALAPIPWSIVEESSFEHDPEEIEEARDKHLCGFHLLQRSDENVYRLHQLIREFFRIKLEQSLGGHILKQAFCQVMVRKAQLTPETPSHDSFWLFAIPHMEEAQIALEEALKDEELIILRESSAKFHEWQGRYDQAKTLFEACQTTSIQLFGNQHPKIAECLSRLALLNIYQGKWQVSEHQCLQALEIIGQRDDFVKVKTLTNLGLVYTNQGKWLEAVKVYQQAANIFLEGTSDCFDREAWLKAFQVNGNFSPAEQSELARILVNWARIDARQANWLDAIWKCHKSLNLFQRLGNPRRAGQSLLLLGSIHQQQGRLQDAQKCFQDGLEIFNVLKDPRGQGQALRHQGTLYSIQGCWDEATEHYQEALKIFQHLNDRKNEALTLKDLGKVHQLMSNLEGASKCSQQALDILSSLDDSQSEGFALMERGDLYITLGDLIAAIRSYSCARGIFHQSQNSSGEGQTLRSLGDACRTLGRFGDAMQYLQESLSIFRRIGDRSGEGEVLMNLGSLYRDINRYDVAIEHLQVALKLFENTHDSHYQGQISMKLGIVYGELADWEQSVQCCQQAIEQFKKLGNSYDEGQALANLGNIYLRKEEQKTARYYLEQASTKLNSASAMHQQLEQQRRSLDWL